MYNSICECVGHVHYVGMFVYAILLIVQFQHVLLQF